MGVQFPRMSAIDSQGEPDLSGGLPRRRSDLTVTEQVLLLVLDDGGPATPNLDLPTTLRIAVIADLSLAGAITLEGDVNPLVVTQSGSVGSPLLDSALARLAGLRLESSRRLAVVLGDRGMDPTAAAIDSLVARGVVRRTSGARRLRSKMVVEDAGVEVGLRAGLAQVLRGADPSEDQIAVISVLKTARISRTILHRDVPEMSERDFAGRVSAVGRRTRTSSGMVPFPQGLDRVTTALTVIWAAHHADLLP